MEVTALMDAATQRRNLIAFYFGTEVAVGDIASNRVVDKVARHAYANLRRTIHRFGTHPAKHTIKDYIHASLRTFVAKLATCDSQE